MDALNNLYSKSCDPACEGCTVLKQNKPEHGVRDYDDLKEAEVLFLADSFKFSRGSFASFAPNELALIREIYSGKAALSSSVKCPGVKEADMTPANMKICRTHLQNTLDTVKPKLVFACGNLAMKMLLKRSGITNKRGRMFEYVTEAGHECIVVPIYHPYMVIMEPRHRYLFEVDIKNAINKVIEGNTSAKPLEYTLATTEDELSQMVKELCTLKTPVACDLETTGLNFLRDKILTAAFTSHEKTWVVALDHKEGTLDRDKVISALRKILSNTNNVKVFHNAKFDLKFFHSYNIDVHHPVDTKIMHHFVDENLPKSLMDLVRLYFPEELSKF